MQELWVQGHFPLLLPYTRGQAESQASVELLKARGDQGTVSPQSTTSFSMSMPPSTFPPAPSWPHGRRSSVQVCPQKHTRKHNICTFPVMHTDSGHISLLPHCPLHCSRMSLENISFFFSSLFYEILFQFSFFVSLQFNTADLLHLYECNLIRFDWKCWQHSQLSPQLSSHFN